MTNTAAQIEALRTALAAAEARAETAESQAAIIAAEAAQAKAAARPLNREQRRWRLRVIRSVGRISTLIP
ncbi:MAG: hypothetical protein ACFCUS_13200 [Rubrimonas sp.]